MLCLELGRLAAEPTSGKAWSVTQESCPVPLTVRGTQALVSFAPLAFNLLRVQHTPYDGAVPAAAAAQRTAAVATLRIAAVHRVWSLPRGQAKWRQICETRVFEASARVRVPLPSCRPPGECYMTIWQAEPGEELGIFSRSLFGEQAETNRRLRKAAAGTRREQQSLETGKRIGTTTAFPKSCASALPALVRAIAESNSTPSTRREQ